jgi:phage terminase large subunit-like protein
MTEQISPADILAGLSLSEREELLANLSPETLAVLRYNWEFWARPNQLPPEGDWTTWLVLSGRGFGKSRMGAEWVRKIAKENPGCRIALVAETAADGRDVMVEGESGLLNIDPTLSSDSYQKTNRKVVWPNGSIAYLYNATEPDQLRGPQHHFAWVDELAKFKYVQETWDQLQFGLRLGSHPKQIVTTTPRPIPIIKKLLNDPDCVITKGATKDNMANLAAPFIKQIYDRYEGTRLGRQELEGEVLEDIPGALWSRTSIDEARRPEAPEQLDRIVIAIDPSTSSEEHSDETGIVAVGCSRDADGYNRGYVLADRSLRGTPEEWARKAVALYREFEADRIIAEKNQGGEMVEAVIRAADRNVPVTLVHASRGKAVRAEPISALYEQGRVHHIGRFDELEDQMCTFSADYDRKHGSPDRMDALVWGLSYLFERLTGRRRVVTKVEDNEYTLKDITGRIKNDVYKGKSDTAWMGM